MASEVKIKIKIDDNGSLSVVAKEANKAAKATDKLGTATTKTNKTRSKYHKQEKGVAGATSNSTKGFAKQAQTLNGGSSSLVGAYATLAAHVFAITAAFGVLQRNAGFKQLEQGIIFTGRAAGANLPLVSKNLKEITDNAISTAEAMKAVAIGTSAGFSSSQLEGLTRVAKGASLALGRDMTDALDRLVRGAAKLEPEILDELGIMVRLDETAERFARTIGKNANELSVFEKRMAFTNAIIEQGEQKFGALNAVIEANPYSKLSAQFDSLIKGGLGALDTVLGPIIGGLASSMGMLVGVMGIFATGVVKMMVPALNQGGKAAAALAKNTAASAKAQLASTKTFKDAPTVFNNLQKKMVAGTATSQDMTKAQTSLTKSVALHNKQMPGYIKSHGESSKKVAIKKAKLDAAKLALDSLTRSQHLETQATLQAARADVLNTASSMGLVATYKALTAQIMIEIAAIKASNLTKTTGAAITNTFRMSLNLAMFSVKAFGLALVNAIPVIGQIIFFVSLAIAAFKKLFIAPPTALEEQLEKTKEALEEYPNIIDQLITSYNLASTSAERFETSLRAQVGLMSQTADQMNKVITAQTSAIIAEKAMARAELMRAKIAQKQDNGNSVGNFSGGSAFRDVKNAQTRVGKSDEKKIEVEPTRNAQILILSKHIAAQELLIEVQRQSGEETLIAAENLTKLNSVMDKVIEADTAEALKETTLEMRALSNQTGGILGSFDAAKKSVAAITDLFTKSAQPSGMYADHITAIDTALKNVGTNDRFSEVWKKYKEGFDKYGKKTKKDVEDLLHNLNLVADYNSSQGVRKAGVAEEMEGEVKAGRPMAALETQAGALAYDKTMGEEQSSNALQLGDRQLILEAELNRLAIAKEIRANEEAIRQAKLATATKLMGPQMGVAGETANNLSDVSGTMAGGAPNSEKFAALGEAISPMVENIKALGPDGPLISAAIEGTMVMGEAFTNMFETMGSKSATTSEKMAAGLQAAGAALNAISNIQAAATEKQIGKIDKQIAAEQKRDGKSKQSLEKIKQMEKKKEALKKKAFEKDKKMKMAQVIISTATSIAMAAGQTGIFAPFFAPMLIALGAAQLAAIASTSYEGGGASAPSAPPKNSSVSQGERSNTVDLAKSQSAVGELGYARGREGLGNANNFKPAFTGARYRAAGGSTGFMVGEQGPELFMPDTPGTIVPAGDTAAAGGAGSNVSFNISAMDSAGVEDVLIRQRANIIAMIRESANQVGDTFLENVDTASEGATI